MASHTTLIVAIGIALLLIAALFGMASTTIGIGDDAINNFSNRADSDDGDPEFASTSTKPLMKPNNENTNHMEAII